MGKFTTGHLNEFSSDMISNGNSVTISDVLFSIEALHECNVCDGHPYIELHSDGSLSVIHPRKRTVLESFHNLEEFVECMKIVVKNKDD